MKSIEMAAMEKLESLKVGEQFETQGRLYQVEKIHDQEIDVQELDENGAPTFESDTLYLDMLLIDFMQDLRDERVNLEVDMACAL